VAPARGSGRWQQPPGQRCWACADHAIDQPNIGPPDDTNTDGPPIRPSQERVRTKLGYRFGLQRHIVILRERHPRLKDAEPAQEVLGVGRDQPASARDLPQFNPEIDLVGRHSEISLEIAAQAGNALARQIQTRRNSLDTLIPLVLVLNHALPDILSRRDHYLQVRRHHRFAKQNVRERSLSLDDSGSQFGILLEIAVLGHDDRKGMHNLIKLWWPIFPDRR